MTRMIGVDIAGGAWLEAAMLRQLDTACFIEPGYADTVHASGNLILARAA